jgi:hypothetical protein
VRAQKKAAAVSARLLASPLARPAAVSLTSSAKAQRTANNCCVNAADQAAFLSVIQKEYIYDSSV